MRKILGGPENMDEFIARDPKTGKEAKGFTVRMYDSTLHQWRIYWAPPNGSEVILPAIGHFKEGRGEFYDQEVWNGRVIFVRYVWHDITRSEAHFEQAFSTDGGKSWGPNWIATMTRDSN